MLEDLCLEHVSVSAGYTHSISSNIFLNESGKSLKRVDLVNGTAPADDDVEKDLVDGSS